MGSAGPRGETGETGMPGASFVYQKGYVYGISLWAWLLVLGLAATAFVLSITALATLEKKK